MPRTFSDETVNVSFHNANRAHYTPSPEVLDEWDETLADRYLSKLDQEMSAAGVAANEANRNLVVLLAELSNGQGPTTRLRNACKFFANVWP